jgi:sporulation protein YlmC with PRC-barrel domain
MEEAIMVDFDSVEHIGNDLLITAYPMTNSKSNNNNG